MGYISYIIKKDHTLLHRTRFFRNYRRQPRIPMIALNIITLLLSSTATADMSRKDAANSITGMNDPLCNTRIGCKSIWLLDSNTNIYQDVNRYEFHCQFAITLDYFKTRGITTCGAFANAMLVDNPIAYSLTYVFTSDKASKIGVVVNYDGEIADDSIATRALQVQNVPGLTPVLIQNGGGRFNFEAIRRVTQSGFEVMQLSTFMNLKGDEIYSNGWAVGKFVKLSGKDVDGAYMTGLLKYNDVLYLTDSIPTNLPLPAAVVSSVPAVAGSHNIILARGEGIFFGYYAGPTDELDNLVGKNVAIGTWQGYVNSYDELIAPRIRVIDITMMPPDMKLELDGLKVIDPVVISPYIIRSALTTTVKNLTPHDSIYYGGKASHTGILVSWLTGENSHVEARTYSFKLWELILDIITDNGQTIKQRIDILLAGSNSKQYSEVSSVLSALASIRKLIAGATVPHLLRDFIHKDLQCWYNTSRFIRFRSSSNVEDGIRFSGAGLYDSKSGCVLDDEGTSANRSLCDNNEKPKPVMKAILSVLASFYNLRAYQTRRKYQIDESSAAMNIMIHYNSPDEFEKANGVIVIDAKTEIVTISSQFNATSVTNPENSQILPEIVELRGDIVTTLQVSSLDQQLVLGSRDKYIELAHYARIIFNVYVRQKYEIGAGLDYEFKYLSDRDTPRLVIKQVRPIPITPEAQIPTYLVASGSHTLTYLPQPRLYSEDKSDVDLELIGDLTLTARSGKLTSDFDIYESIRYCYRSSASGSHICVDGDTSSTSETLDNDLVYRHDLRMCKCNKFVYLDMLTPQPRMTVQNYELPVVTLHDFTIGKSIRGDHEVHLRLKDTVGLTTFQGRQIRSPMYVSGKLPTRRHRFEFIDNPSIQLFAAATFTDARRDKFINWESVYFVTSDGDMQNISDIGAVFYRHASVTLPEISFQVLRDVYTCGYNGVIDKNECIRRDVCVASK